MNGLRLNRFHALGLALIASLLAFTLFCIGAYNGWFTATANVLLKIDQAGLQLLQGSDVKLRGILVGEVEDISSDGNGATVALALDPDQLHLVPANVHARLVPKTLFGEKYVDLVIPPDPAVERLEEGDVIPEDRSQAAVEINRLLDNLLPLLRTVRPQDLSVTLHALSQALEGRGNELGQTLVELDTYLAGLNPQLPQLQRDLAALADVATVYDQAAPDLLATVENLLTTADTVVDKQETLRAFFREVAGAADSTRALLDDIGADVIRVNSVSRDVVQLLATYSPVFPCFFAGYAILEPNIATAIGQTPETDHFAHIVASFIPPVPEYRYPIDLPEYLDDSGPNCYGLPTPSTPPPKVQFRDGTEDDPRFVGQPSSGTASVRPSAMRGGVGAGIDDVDAVLAPVLGVPARDVPAIGALLWAPALRGTEVTLR